jgi:hypothetical protein
VRGGQRAGAARAADENCIEHPERCVHAETAAASGMRREPLRRRRHDDGEREGGCTD